VTGGPTPPAAGSYDNVVDFGTLYDAIPAYQERDDVGFYLAEAARAGPGSRVLEIGCGTGRVLLPMARAGHVVTGLDASPAMLARFRSRLEAEAAGIRKRVTLVEGDTREFSLADRWPLITAPFRILQHLLTPADQLRCLATVARHLEPGGRFVFDVFNPNFAALLQDRSTEVEETPEVALPDGRFLRRAVRITSVRWIEQASDVELIYCVRDGSGTHRIVQAFTMRWYGAAELEHLLARAGFIIEAQFGGVDRRPLTDTSPEIVTIATHIEK